MGRKVHFYDECHSTNDVAQQLVYKNSAIEGELVICQHQSAGKGQQGNQWDSEPGKNLTFSVILSPRFLKADEQFRLNMVVSLALWQTLKNLELPAVKIKWPNDILIRGKKVAGILIENLLSGSYIKHSIIGIGLNVNQQVFDYPNASSLCMEGGTVYNLNLVLELFLENLERYYLGLSGQNSPMLNLQFLSELYGMNENRRFEDEKGQYEGVIKGIMATGQLIIAGRGVDNLYNFKEVKFLF